MRQSRHDNVVMAVRVKVLPVLLTADTRMIPWKICSASFCPLVLQIVIINMNIHIAS